MSSNEVTDMFAEREPETRPAEVMLGGGGRCAQQRAKRPDWRRQRGSGDRQ